MWQYGVMALGGAYRAGKSSVILAQKWGVGNNHRLLAFSQKEYFFIEDKLLSHFSPILNINIFITVKRNSNAHITLMLCWAAVRMQPSQIKADVTVTLYGIMSW